MQQNTPRLYSDLAWLWPLWGTPADYADWCHHVTRYIRQYAKRDLRTLLNLGCGGGKNVFNLKTSFEVTGVDISQAMLDLARTLNPECAFVLDDMRTCSLGQEFDAVLIDDAISYMTTRPELSAVFQTAYRHLADGGVLVVSPDITRETFCQNRTRVSYADITAKPPDTDIVFIENDYDPDPADDHYEGTLVYLIRKRGQLRVESDRHLFGLFTLAVWRTALRDAGFTVHEETYVEEEQGCVTFVCIKST